MDDALNSTLGVDDCLAIGVADTCHHAPISDDQIRIKVSLLAFRFKSFLFLQLEAWPLWIFPLPPISTLNYMFKINRNGLATTLSKTLLTAGLLGAAALSTLGAGSAQAATGCAVEITWSAWVGGQTLTCSDKEFKWLSTQVLGDLNDPSSVVSAVEPNIGDYLFNLDKPFTGLAFDFTYEASITAANFVFTEVDIDSNAISSSSPPSVLVGTYTFTGTNSPVVLTSTNGSSSFDPVNGGPTTITVNNNYNGAGGAIDTMQNSFQQRANTDRVPGPLPLLGAGAAFGFSRRIRSRIKGARLV
jgi:hypothetical protein